MITVEELGAQIMTIIDQDGDDKTDGEVIDEIVYLLAEYGVFTQKD